MTPIKTWHGGKIVICWIVTAASTWFAFMVLSEGNFDRSGPGPSRAQLLVIIPFVSVLLGGPITAVVITWKWLTGREKQHHD